MKCRLLLLCLCCLLSYSDSFASVTFKNYKHLKGHIDPILARINIDKKIKHTSGDAELRRVVREGIRDIKKSWIPAISFRKKVVKDKKGRRSVAGGLATPVALGTGIAAGLTGPLAVVLAPISGASATAAGAAAKSYSKLNDMHHILHAMHDKMSAFRLTLREDNARLAIRKANRPPEAERLAVLHYREYVALANDVSTFMAFTSKKGKRSYRRMISGFPQKVLKLSKKYRKDRNLYKKIKQKYQR